MALTLRDIKRKVFNLKFKKGVSEFCAHDKPRFTLKKYEEINRNKA